MLPWNLSKELLLREDFIEERDRIKAIDVTRSIDNLGRFVIPMELRKQYNLKNRQMFDIYVTGTDIHLRPTSTTDKNSGMVRRLDMLGRITLPMEIRKRFGITTSVEFFVSDNELMVRKYTPSDSCVFCDSVEHVPDNYLEVNAKLVCPAFLKCHSPPPDPEYVSNVYTNIFSIY